MVLHVDLLQVLGHVLMRNTHDTLPGKQLTNSTLFAQIFLIAQLRHDLPAEDESPWLRPSLLEFCGISIRALGMLHKDQLGQDVRVGGIGTDASGELRARPGRIRKMCLRTHIMKDAIGCVFAILMHAIAKGSVTVVPVLDAFIAQFFRAPMAISAIFEHGAF